MGFCFIFCFYLLLLSLSAPLFLPLYFSFSISISLLGAPMSPFRFIFCRIGSQCAMMNPSNKSKCVKNVVLAKWIDAATIRQRKYYARKTQVRDHIWNKKKMWRNKRRISCCDFFWLFLLSFVTDINVHLFFASLIKFAETNRCIFIASFISMRCIIRIINRGTCVHVHVIVMIRVFCIYSVYNVAPYSCLPCSSSINT